MIQSELVERITKEVVQSLTARNAGTVHAQTAGGRNILTAADLPPYIDHTLLRPEASGAQIDKLCDEAIKYKFCSVCVNGSWVAHCARRLSGTGVKVAAVVGFPLGAMLGRAKNLEARHAIEDGAREIDMVMNIGALKSGDLKLVEDDILWVVRACTSRALLKVILETALLTDQEKILACQIAKNAGADFVKTSTGFSTHGATVADVALMRRTVGPTMGVKAAGGVRNFADAVALIEAGATRLGTSSGVKIVMGSAAEGDY